MISPLAYIHPEAKIGENVEIAPFVFIDKNVVIGDNNKIMANANILYGSRIGNGNTIFPGAVIGAIPQDLKFRGEESTAEIGDNNLIRENVTINRGTAAKGRTIVGNNNLLMEGVHVAHDALVGNGCIIGNSTKMAGEIVIDDNAIVSANVLMHQFCHVGSHVMIQGGCRFSKDIPPYIIAGREPIAFSGINIIGLRRRGFSNEVIESIHNAYRIIYQSGLNTTEALKKIEDEFEKSPEIDYIVNFRTLFEFIFYFFQCFCRVQTTLVDDTICIVNTFDHFIGEATTAQADDVDSAESDRFASCNDVRRNIFTETASALNHYMTAYMTKLMHQYIGADNRVIINDDFACHLGRVTDDTSVTNQCVVCYVYTFHQ